MPSAQVDTLGFSAYVSRFVDFVLLKKKKLHTITIIVIKEGIFYLNIKTIFKKRYFNTKDF